MMIYFCSIFTYLWFYIFIILLINCTGGQDEKLLDLIIPQYNALNPPSTLVDMSKQSGRDLSLPGMKRPDEVDVFVAQDALGSEDRLLSIQIAVEKDKAVGRGLAHSSNQRKTPAFNMNHQSGRAGAVLGVGALEVDENGHVTNEKHVLDLVVKDNKAGKTHFMILILGLINYYTFHPHLILYCLNFSNY